jgi:hypothetical protein
MTGDVAGPYRCDHCGEPFRSRRARGAHVGAAHPFSRVAPNYNPPPDITGIELHGARWSA